MKWAAVAMTAMMTAMLGLASVAVWPARPATAQDAAPSSDNAAPGRTPARPPARIRVRPLVQSYPGPNAVRQCAFWLATEYRPSGTVIVPRQHCWWERG